MQATVDLSGQYIRWPNCESRHVINVIYNVCVYDIRSTFEDEGGFPGIIGLIDGTHIWIRAPEHELTGRNSTC